MRWCLVCPAVGFLVYYLWLVIIPFSAMPGVSLLCSLLGYPIIVASVPAMLFLDTCPEIIKWTLGRPLQLAFLLAEGFVLGILLDVLLSRRKAKKNQSSAD